MNSRLLTIVFGLPLLLSLQSLAAANAAIAYPRSAN